ncbi:flagellar hook-basal body complex protein FliE [Aromatoleum sp.]|uniref:flagellar hook-basal body complex protein FliE n=1 Tax=Aromatoleum sp. TaxID=2307007 RepID=UPI002FC6C0C4
MNFDPAMATAPARAGVAEAGIVPASSVAQGEAGAPRFAESLWQAVQGVDDKSRDAGERMAAVDSGRSDDLVGAMLASQEASLSFSMLMQVRNKVVGAVDELIKLQL